MQAIVSHSNSLLRSKPGAKMRATKLQVLGKGGFGTVTLCESLGSEVRFLCALVRLSGACRTACSATLRQREASP